MNCQMNNFECFILFVSKSSKSNIGMGKKNIPVIAYFQFTEVKLHKKYKDQFQLSYARGKNLGRSDLVRPNGEFILKFDTTAQINCTFQQFSSTKEFKPKRLIIVLRRFVDPSTSTIFAKFEIDLTEFYQKGDVIKQYSMVSKHESKPILTFKCFIEENSPLPKSWSKSKDAPEDIYEESTNLDSEIAMALAGEEPNDMPVELQTLTNQNLNPTPSVFSLESGNASSEEKNKQKPQIASQDAVEIEEEETPNESSESTDLKQPPTTENPPDSPRSEKKVVFSSIDRKEVEEKEVEEEDEEEEEEEEAQEKKAEAEAAMQQLTQSTSSLNQNKPLAPIAQQRAKTAKILNAGAFQKMGHISSISKALQKPVLSILDVFNYLLTKELPPLAQFSYLDPDHKEFPYPPGVMPIYQTICVYNLFTGYKCETEMYEKAMDLFFKLYPKAPLTSEEEIEQSIIEQQATAKQAKQGGNGAPLLKLQSSASFQMQLTDENAMYRSREDTYDQFNDDFQPHYEDHEKNFKKVVIKDNCSLEQRFMTTLLIILLTTHHIASQGYKIDRVKPFIEKMLDLLKGYASQMYSDKLPEFDEMINRFVTGRFQQDELKQAFIEKYQSVVDGFKFLPSVNRFLINLFNRTIDAAIFNKILSNPARFTFSKAAIWNTFLASLSNENQLVFKQTTECVSCILMAVNIATQSQSKELDLIESLCPDLDHKTIFYILKNYRPDNILQMTINYVIIAKKLQIDQNDNTFTPMEPLLIEDYQSAGDSLKLYNWNQCKLDPNLLSKFPFLLVQKQ